MNNDTNQVPETEEHGTFFGIFLDFIMEIYGALKYIFYDVWRGKPPV